MALLLVAPTGSASGAGITAELSNFKVTLNGVEVDNKNLEYPLLVYNNITYCPLTWEYCVGNFNWEYSFSSDAGLVINSTNPFVAQYTLPSDIAGLDDPLFAVTMTAKHIYYYDGNGGKSLKPMAML